jgi:integrase/recombinase XerD
MELKELEPVFLMEFTSKSTIDTYSYSLKSFFAFLKSKNIENVNDISIPILKQWRNGLNLSYASRSKIICVRSFLKWLFVNDYIHKNTGKCLKSIPKPDPLVERICGKTDINHLIKLAESTHQPTALMLKILYWTGIRLTACCTILKRNITMGESMTIKVLSKGNCWRTVHICKEKADRIRDQINSINTKYLFAGRYKNTAISRSAGHRRIKKIASMGALDHVTAHVYRHCFATFSLEAGASLIAVRDAMNHKSINTTTLYLHATEKDVSRYI